MSVRARLLAWLLVGLSAALAPVAWVTWRRASDEVNLLLDYQLRETALSLRRQSLLSIAIGREAAGGDEADTVVQIWDGATGLMYVSSTDRALPLLPVEGFGELALRGDSWRAYVVRSEGRTVQVAQSLATRRRLAADSALRALLPYALLVPLAALIVWAGVGYGLRPLARVAEAVARRQPEALDPIPLDGLPQEVRSLGAALNALLARLGEAFATQRQFVADAAHELRTPLAALRLQLQNLERAADESDRREAAAALSAGLDRATRLVEQLLALARLAPEAHAPVAEVRLDALVRSVVVDLSPVAQANGIDLGVVAAERLALSGEPSGLTVMLRNLVDNALRYTPRGGRVDVSVAEKDGAAVLEVSDTGPGIPESERERVFDRFFRGEASDSAHGTGSGLGLAIVRRVVERHRGRIELGETGPGRGLRVTLTLPCR